MTLKRVCGGGEVIIREFEIQIYFGVLIYYLI